MGINPSFLNVHCYIFAAAADGANASLSSKSCVGEAFTEVKLNKKKKNTFVNNFKTAPLLYILLKS